MAAIAELFATLGVRVDSSWAKAGDRIRAMGKLYRQKVREMAKASNQAAAAARREAAALNAKVRLERAQAAQVRVKASLDRAHRIASSEQSIQARKNAQAMARQAREQAQVAARNMRIVQQQSRAAAKNAQAQIRHSARVAKAQAREQAQAARNAVRNRALYQRVMGGGGGGGAGGGGRGGGGLVGGIAGLRTKANFASRAFTGMAAFAAGHGLVELADGYTNIQNRLSTITGSQAEANVLFERLRGIAKTTRAPLESTAESFVRVTNATKTMGLSQEDTFKFVERLNMAVATSGATGSEARAGIQQLTQALAKGKLDGDEFRSIAENMPNILALLGKSMGKTEGELRKMSKAGELTRESIVKAFLGPNDIVDKFGRSIPTVGSKFQKFKDDMMVAFGLFAQDTNLAENLGIALEYLAKALIALIGALKTVVGWVRDFWNGLKEGRGWAWALAAVLTASLIPSILGLYRALKLATLSRFTLGLLNMANAARSAAGWLGLAGNAGVAVGGAGAGAAGAAGGAARGAAGAAAKGGGLKGLAGLLAFAGPVGLGIGGGLAFSEIMNEVMPTGPLWDYMKQQLAQKSGASVNQTININGVKDAAQIPGAIGAATNEALERQLRHASAATGGS